VWILAALLLVIVLVACWLINLLALPGNWLMAAATAAYVLLVPTNSSVAVGWKVAVAMVVMAALGELAELLTATAGTARAGGSRRSALLALAGSAIGAVAGMIVGLPIPLLGSLLAAVLFAGLGAMAGAILGERWAGRDPAATWRVAKAAFWGRLTGTLAKLVIGAVMVCVAVAAIVF
jgi:uncharacterized protein